MKKNRHFCFPFRVRFPDADLTFRCSLTTAVLVWDSEFGCVEDANFFVNSAAECIWLLFGTQHTRSFYQLILKIIKVLCLQKTILLEQLFMEELQLITGQSHKPPKLEASVQPKIMFWYAAPHHRLGQGTKWLAKLLYCPRPFQMGTIDDVSKLRKPGWFFAIINVKAAYRNVPVYPAHRQLPTRIFLEVQKDVDSSFVDNFLCFDLTNAPSTFRQFPSAIAMRVKAESYRNVSYLDDFIIIAVITENVFWILLRRQ